MKKCNTILKLVVVNDLIVYILFANTLKERISTAKFIPTSCYCAKLI